MLAATLRTTIGLGLTLFDYLVETVLPDGFRLGLPSFNRGRGSCSISLIFLSGCLRPAQLVRMMVGRVLSGLRIASHMDI